MGSAPPASTSSWELLAVATLGLTLSAELWWVYFIGDDDQAEEALREMSPTRGEFFATNVAYYWAHLVMLLGIVCIAAGLERAIGHAFDALSFAQALELGGGTALYLAGHALFRAVLGLSFKPWRAVALVLALATIPLGTETSALVQLAVLVAGLGACNAADGLDTETNTGVRRGADPVASLGLGLVEGLVGGGEHPLIVEAGAACRGGRSEADRERRAIADYVCRDGTAEVLRDRDAFPRVGPRQQNEEFLATDPVGEVERPQPLPHEVAHVGERGVHRRRVPGSH